MADDEGGGFGDWLVELVSKIKSPRLIALLVILFTCVAGAGVTLRTICPVNSGVDFQSSDLFTNICSVLMIAFAGGFLLSLFGALWTAFQLPASDDPTE